MRNKTYEVSAMGLIRGTSVALKIMLDCPLDFLEKEVQEKVKQALEEYAKAEVGKAIANSCIERGMK